MRKRILICPLDWGLGHATRCIPVIHELERQQCEIFIASTGQALSLLKLEFPNHIFFEIASYGITYSQGNSMILNLIPQLPKVLRAIGKEREEVHRIVQRERIDLIISDNRFGCYHPAVKSVFITHQLSIQLPLGLRWMNHFNRRLIRKFDECWIPDSPDRTLSGALSQSTLRNLFFIGPLSRMKRTGITTKKRNPLLLLLSGPEPQRSILERILLKQVTDLGLEYILVRGLPDATDKKPNTFNYLMSQQLNTLIELSDLTICRSGYSTIMDLAVLGKKVIFVPTPGQTEQIYLANKLKTEGIAHTEDQSTFDLRSALTKAEAYKGFDSNKDDQSLLLAERITDVLKNTK